MHLLTISRFLSILSHIIVLILLLYPTLSYSFVLIIFILIYNTSSVFTCLIIYIYLSFPVCYQLSSLLNISAPYQLFFLFLKSVKYFIYKYLREAHNIVLIPPILPYLIHIPLLSTNLFPSFSFIHFIYSY